MTTANVNGLPDGLLAEMAFGIMAQEGAYMDEFCTKIGATKTTLQGRIGIDDGYVARGDEHEGLAPGAEAKAFKDNYSNQLYDALARPGYGFLSDELANNYESVGGQNAAAMQVKKAIIEQSTRKDRYASEQLLDQDKNVLFTPSAAWSIVSSPIRNNLLTMMEDSAPGADTVIYGKNIKNFLLASDDFQRSNIGNSVMGGNNNDILPALDAWLISLGFTNAHYYKRLIDTAVVGKPQSIAYDAPDLLWVGHKSAFICIHPAWSGQDLIEQERVVKKRGFEIQATSYDDYVRTVKNMGAVGDVV